MATDKRMYVICAVYPPCDSLMHSALPADPKNKIEYLISIQHGAAACQNYREDPMKFLKISKMCLNFMS